MPVHPKKGSVEAQEWAARMQEARAKKKRMAQKIRQAGLKTEREFFGPGGPLEVKRRIQRNPSEDWHKEAARIAEKHVRSAVSAMEKTLYKGMQVAHEDSARAAKSFKTKDTNRIKSNPLAIYNPPEVAGVIYNNAIEIRAQKTNNLKGFYKHIFESKNVQILGLTNGDVLLHHKHGKRLWISQKDYERSGRRH